MIDNSYSPLSPLNHSIPQVSVLGPSLFAIYIRHISDLIKNFPNIHYHIFADDIQLFTFSPIHYHTINSELISTTMHFKCTHCDLRIIKYYLPCIFCPANNNLHALNQLQLTINNGIMLIVPLLPMLCPYLILPTFSSLA